MLFWKFYGKGEIALYCALDRLDMMEENDLWNKVYEMGIKQKIQPRDRLVRAYEYSVVTMVTYKCHEWKCIGRFC